MSNTTPGTSVAVAAPTPTAPTMVDVRKMELEKARERNAITTAIRGQMWAKEATEGTIRAVSEYCYRNGLDPMRHVELLGGRIYLTATAYQEKAAPYIRRGIFVPQEPDLIQADERLDALAEAGDEWGIAERTRRMRLRILHGVPENAAAACIFRIVVAASGASFTGVNWAGPGLKMVKKEIWEPGPTGKRQPTGRFEEKDSDPVGAADPVKTAITRAERRAWIQLVEGGSVAAITSEFARLEADRERAHAQIEADVEQWAVQPPVNDPPRGRDGAVMVLIPPTDTYGNTPNPPTEGAVRRSAGPVDGGAAIDDLMANPELRDFSLGQDAEESKSDRMYRELAEQDARL
jgi:hypothetical protein